MLYKQILNDWLADQEIYKKGGTFTVYYNVAHNQILPHLGNMDVDQIDSDVLQDFVLGQLDHGRVDGKGGIAKSYADSIISVLKLSLNRKDLEIRLPYNPPKEVEIFDKADQIALINHLQTEISYKTLVYYLLSIPVSALASSALSSGRTSTLTANCSTSTRL